MKGNDGQVLSSEKREAAGVVGGPAPASKVPKTLPARSGAGAEAYRSKLVRIERELKMREQLMDQTSGDIFVYHSAGRERLAALIQKLRTLVSSEMGSSAPQLQPPVLTPAAVAKLKRPAL